LEVQSVLLKDLLETRIIFISGRDDPSVRQAALDAGAFGFLSKPFDDEVLFQPVRKAVAALQVVVRGHLRLQSKRRARHTTRTK
jgi:FixJ family two-component response regulator